MTKGELSELLKPFMDEIEIKVLLVEHNGEEIFSVSIKDVKYNIEDGFGKLRLVV